MRTQCYRWWQLVVLLLIWTMNCPARAKDVLFAAVDNSPPFLMTKKSITSDAGVDGIDWELLQELSYRTGVQIYPLHYPLMRALKDMQAGRVDLITSLYKTQKRSEYIGYLDTPYYSCHVQFYASPELAKRVHTYGDLYGKSIGYLRGAEYFPQFDSDKKLTRHPVTTVHQLPGKLLKRYDQLFIGTDCQINYMLKDMGLSEAIVPTQYNPGYKLDLYIGYSKTANIGDKLPALNNALAELVAEGWVDKVAQSYMNPPSF